MSDDDYDVYTEPEDPVSDKLNEINSTLEAIRDELPRPQPGGSDVWQLFWIFVVILLLENWPGSKLDRWTDRVWYSMYYSAKWTDVDINKRPFGCDFLHAPIGGKGCHYSKGKFTFTDADRQKAIREATTEEDRQAITARPNSVMVYWEKKED